MIRCIFICKGVPTIIAMGMVLFIMGMMGCAVSQQSAVTKDFDNPSSQQANMTAHNPTAQSESSEEPMADPEEELMDFEDFEDTDQPGMTRVPDPLAPWNRLIFRFNDKLYFWVLKPVSSGYKYITPDPIRVSVHNFFQNLATPIRFVNCLLQGKVMSAGKELGSFFLNSTVGVLGIATPASTVMGWKPQDEDLGQTLAVYGMGEGLYIVWPVLGPSTARDSFGALGDRFLNPATYVSPAELAYGLVGLKTINETSLRIGVYEALKAAAIEPYSAFRDAYIQNRYKKISE